MKGTSNAPLILGIVGAILMLPGLMCAVVCGGLVDAGSSGGSYTAIGTIVGGAPIVAGILGGLKGKSNPGLSFILLLFSFICALLGWYLTAFTSMFHLLALICFIVGAIMVKKQKPESSQSLDIYQNEDNNE